MVNVISHIVLTRSLQPLLDQTAAEPNSDVRIVIVSSDVQRIVSGTPRFRNLDDINTEYKDALFPAFARYCMLYFLAEYLEPQGSFTRHDETRKYTLCF